MKFLVDEDLPRSTAEVFRRYGHEAVGVWDAGLQGQPDDKIATHAQERGSCLVTADQGFCNITHYPPVAYAGLVVLTLPRDATAQVILNLVESFACHPEILEQLPGKLAIVEFGRVRLRSQ